MRFVLALVAAATLGLAACSPAEQNAAESDADAAATEVGEAASDAGAAIGEAAHETGEAVEGAVNETATAVEHATDDNEATK